MKNNDQSLRWSKLFHLIPKGLMLFSMLFGLNQLLIAQETASFYNMVDGEIVDEITLEPGQTVDLVIGVDNTGPVDGVTATLLFNPDEIQIEGGITDLVGFLLPIPFANEVDNENGYISFTKGNLGGAAPAGGFEYMQLTIVVNPDLTSCVTSQLVHKMDGNDMSNIVYFGDELLENAPSFSIHVDACEDFDCPDLEANIGDPCDDGDDNTENDTVTENCECVGTPIWDCPALEANVGDPCDDGDDNTENDTVTENCECVGTPVWDCPELEANVGDACDDGDDNTENDTVNENCECVGTPIWDCPELEANVGDACDDGDDNTENDVVGTDCVCAGTPIWDCPELEANIGDPCDDGDDSTENDTVNESCECVGTPIDDCEAEGGAIEFEEGGTSYTVCVDDGEPSMVALNVTEPANDDYPSAWVITDPDLNVLAILETQADVEGIDFDNAGPGNCLIWVLNFDPDNSNVVDLAEEFEDGGDVNAGDLEGCYDLSNAATVVRVNCQPSDCEVWDIYMNDNEGGETDIYGVDISSGDAVLTYITTLDFHAHMAFNEADKLLYVINNTTGYYVTVDPSTAEVSDPVMLSEDIASITTAVFAPNGKLLVGSATDDVIYCIDIADASVSTFDAYAPVSGGDIAFDSMGKLYLATRSGNGLYEVYPDDVMDDMWIGSVPNLVTGMALTDGDQLLTSHNGNPDLHLFNLDGSDSGTTYPLILDGEPFMHNNGDLASGCNDSSTPLEGECTAFSTFYTDINRPGVVGSDLYSVMFTESGDAEMTYLTNVAFSAHIAYNPTDDLVYLVNASGAFITVYDVSTGTFAGDLPIVGEITDIVAVVYEASEDDDHPGILYVGSSASDDIHTIDLATGVATFLQDAPVQGGDLSFKDGSLYLATRNGSKLYDVSGGGAVEVGSIPSLVNGMAEFNDAEGDDRTMVIANRGMGEFLRILASDGSTAESYTATIGGEAVMLYDGDLASGCADEDPLEIGGCYASEIVEYVEGTAMGGGSIAADRADASQALGEPERTDELVFVSLGYGGSLTVGFGGIVPNGDGDDIEVVETSFNNPGCESYPEYADVYVSMDGVDWHMAGNVCKGDPYVDISDAGDFDYVMYVRIVNHDGTTTSSDGFDVDGVVAIHNCDDDGSEEGPADIASNEATSVMTSYPNPTNGPSQVMFTTANTARTLVEVYDMKGRSVETLFNQEAQAGQEYRLDFDGSNLPNGVYIYRLTTDNEVIVEKFMITK